MRPSQFVHRLVPIACLVLTTFLATGCSPEEATAIVRSRTLIAKTAAVKDHYLAVVAKANGGLDQLFTFEDVYAPFRLEVTGGLFDPKHSDLGGGTYEIQIFPFKVLCTPTANGTTVAAQKDSGASTFGSLDFPGAAVLDIAVEYDGTTLTVLARNEADAQYSTVGTTVVHGLSSVEPRLEVDGLKKGAVVGFDDIRVALRGHRAGQLTQPEQAVDSLYTAIDHLCNALYAADGAGDAALAKQEIAAALPLMTSAGTILDGLPASDGRTKARKKLASGLKAANGAAKALNAGKKLATIFPLTIKALGDTGTAARSARFL